MSVTYRNFKTHSHSDGLKLRQHMMGQHKSKLIEFPSTETQIMPNEDEEYVEKNQRAIGYVYQTGPQKLKVTVPGDVVPVSFGSHTILTGLHHDEDSPDMITAVSGIYEISYCVNVTAVNSAHVAFAVQADGQTVDGSMTAKLINTQECAFSASVLTQLDAGVAIRLVMTSSSAVSAETAGNGVSASMMIKKID